LVNPGANAERRQADMKTRNVPAAKYPSNP
jgi:hypothetical protein